MIRFEWGDTTSDGSTAHLRADPSRELIETISITEALEWPLKVLNLLFSIDDYRKTISLCNAFLSRSGGSTIPSNDKMNYTIKSQFSYLKNQIVLETRRLWKIAKLIGEGSEVKSLNISTIFYQKKLLLLKEQKKI